MKDNHPCLKGGLKGECAICMENLHELRTDVDLLNCGHAIHS